ncbi:hypothetical protein [Pseudomonas viridiflava]|uniref:hypothetical protein n=1 Tax=Pseudomonas viridiflava TaxID=33069 RepID=UPI000F031AE4|nr:hypothetical protein [Pseudomonas viridiflava]
MSASVDDKVLEHLRSIPGSTAWVMTSAVGEPREAVSKACQRLKRKGLLIVVGSYWSAIKPGPSR